MSIPISGTLYDPFGNVARFADIKFVTLQGSGDVIESSSAVYRTDENGTYSIDVQLGRYAVYMRFNGNNGAYDKIQTITVNSDVVASTLGELLEYTEPLTPAEILIVQQLAAEAVAAKDDAQAAALQAAIDESLAAASALSAQASATAAANSVALLAPVAVNGGVWASGQQFTAYNQYMIYSGEAYSPLPATTLPYAVGATPDLGFVYQIALNDHSKLANRNAVGAHDASAVNTNSGSTVQDEIDLIIKYNTIYVSPTINTPTSNPPIYNSLASAMASITDNGEYNRYTVELLSGIHDAHGILLKDYVDIVRSPLSGTQVIIEHDFLASDSFKIRDIFKTANTPYDATDTFPVRCKIEGLYIRGENLNYCIHADFNDHPELDIEINDCILFNGDAATTATTSDYALGVGIYGGQRIVSNRTVFYGRYDASLPVERQQGSGWIVHNRASQVRPCHVEFNDCKSLKGFYGGRIVDYGSGQEDIVSINGGVLKGELGNLLCFSNGLTGAIPASITVVGNVPVTRVALQQQINSSGTIYHCDFPVVIQGFSEMYINGEATDLERGDLVTLNAYGTKATKTSTSIRYRYAMGGVVINPAASRGRVAVQKTGIAAVKFSGASISSNTEVSNSSTEAGKIQAAVTGDGVFGATVVSTSFSTGVTSGLAWVNINYGGTK